MKKIAIITGASSGLGKEFTFQIAQNYFYDEIWIIARRIEKLKEITNIIQNEYKSQKIRPIQIDLSNQDGISLLKNEIETENNRLKKSNSHLCVGLLVNNAGFGTYGTFEQTPLFSQLEMIEINCVSLTAIAGIVLPFLEKNSLIINTSSLAAFMPLGNFSVYAASKSFVLSFSISLAVELKSKGIKVCALCPGSVSTEFAKIASNGARQEVKGGIPTKKVVSHALKCAFKGKKIILYRPKWKITAFLSRFVSRFFVANWTYKHAKRPRND